MDETDPLTRKKFLCFSRRIQLKETKITGAFQTWKFYCIYVIDGNHRYDTNEVDQNAISVVSLIIRKEYKIHRREIVFIV